MIGYFLVLGNRRGFCYGSSVQYGEEHVSIRPTFTAYLPDLSHFIIFIGRREQSSAEVERSSLSLSLCIGANKLHCCRFGKALHWPGDPALLGLERVQVHQGRRLVSYQFIAQLVKRDMTPPESQSSSAE